MASARSANPTMLSPTAVYIAATGVGLTFPPAPADTWLHPDRSAATFDSVLRCRYNPLAGSWDHSNQAGKGSCFLRQASECIDTAASALIQPLASAGAYPAPCRSRGR